jgi:hypothetical protein
MANTINKLSTLVSSQLPEFVRDDLNYETFVAFVEAYYEWMELVDTSNSASTIVNTTQQGTTYGLKNLLNYSDVDSTLDDFLKYYISDFLPNFPQTILSDKAKIVKLAKALYQTKGTPASYKLLFRLLYNSDAELLFTRDLVFRASASEWYIPKYLRIQSSDETWLSPELKNLSLFGDSSKSFGVIENSVTTTDPRKYNVYISQIQRLFTTGETVSVVDSFKEPVYFKDGVIVDKSVTGSYQLKARVIGSISNINIDRNHRGNRYKVGDPVVVFGGTIDPSTAVRAEAQVSETTRGSIQRINILNGGRGYRPHPNTKIIFSGGGGSGALARVQTVNTAVQPANVTFVGTDTIAIKQHIRLDAFQYNFAANTSANNQATLANTFSFTSFETYPIDSIIVDNGGGGFTSIPTITADSLYYDELPSEQLWIKDGVIYTSNVFGSIPISSNTHSIASTGILAPIEIVSRGLGYQVNDKIIFSGGSGTGAFANVITVDGQGRIESIKYVSNYLNTDIYPLGGMGYTNQFLPNVSVISSNVSASGAQISVPGILGTGAEFSAETDRIGAITTIGISNFGEDYVSQPDVSFRVQDLVITNISDVSSITPELRIVQGSSETYSANVDSIINIKSTPSIPTDVYRLRVFNYRGNIDFNSPLTIINSNPDVANVTVTLTNEFDGVNSYQNGIYTYGDGTAKGTSRFLNGLIFGTGRYLDFVGHPSNYAVLQSDIYNDYTYILSVERPISLYRDIVKNLIHPAGMRLIGRSLLKNEKDFDFFKYEGIGLIQPLQYWINWPVGDPTASVTLQVEANNISSNVITVNTTVESGAYNNLSNTDIVIIESNNQKVSASISFIDESNNKIYLDNDIWLTYSNVAYAYANTQTNRIIISDLSTTNTPNYDIVNNRQYSNSNNHIEDIIFAGDKLTIEGFEYRVRTIDYTGNIISIEKAQGTLVDETGNNLIQTEDSANNILLGEYVLTHGSEQFPLPITINRTINSTKVYIKKLE